MKKEQLKRNVVSLVIGVVIGLPIAAYAVTHPTQAEPIVIIESVPYVTTEATTIPEEVEISKMEITTEETTTATVLMDVPVSEDLQLYIINLCEERNISPALVMAVIERESCFKAEVIGDNGDSFGLMQIQPKWHQERMDKLGCTDLLNPYDNVTVGIDILTELLTESNDITYVLMAYNGGSDYAKKMQKKDKVSNYASTVIERAEELGKGVY